GEFTATGYPLWPRPTSTPARLRARGGRGRAESRTGGLSRGKRDASYTGKPATSISRQPNAIEECLWHQSDAIVARGRVGRGPDVDVVGRDQAGRGGQNDLRVEIGEIVGITATGRARGDLQHVGHARGALPCDPDVVA